MSWDGNYTPKTRYWEFQETANRPKYGMFVATASMGRETGTVKVSVNNCG